MQTIFYEAHTRNVCRCGKPYPIRLKVGIVSDRAFALPDDATMTVFVTCAACGAIWPCLVRPTA